MVALYNAGDVKTYSFDPILRPLIDDIQLLERDGLNIITDVFEGTVKITIAQVTGDNLGVNGILGFVESFVSNHFCRHCSMHRNEMMAKTDNPDLLRNHDDYERDIELNDPATTGIKRGCPLNDIHNFHVTSNYAPDVMHGLTGRYLWFGNSSCNCRFNSSWIF